MTDVSVLLLGAGLVFVGLAILAHIRSEHGRASRLPAKPFGAGGPSIPLLTWDPADVVKDLPLQIGFNGIRWDGEAFPFVTIGDVVITAGDDALMTAKVEIAVRLPE